VEGEQGHREEGDKAVDTGALVRREDLPPLHGTVGEDHGHVERHHRGENMVEVQQGYHCGVCLEIIRFEFEVLRRLKMLGVRI